MAVSFSHTLRSFHADGFRPSALTIVTLTGLLGVWFAWFLLMPISLYETSAEARVQVVSKEHVVEAPVLGRIVSVDMQVGQSVTTGDPLVELETASEASRIEEEGARLSSLRTRLITLQATYEAESQAMPSARRSEMETIGRARAIHREATAGAEHAEAQEQRMLELAKQGLASQADVDQATAAATQSRAEVDAAQRDLRRLQAQAEFSESQRMTKLKEMESQIDAVRGEISMVEAASHRLGYELAQRSIRAPISGHLGEVSELRPGSVVVPGERIAVVIPEGEFMVRAVFPAGTALGRVKAGQRADMRLAAFPWISFGELEAEVVRIGTETERGGFTVELTIAENQDTDIVLQHGQPGQVSIGVEKVTPVEVLMRAVGKRFQSRRASGPSTQPQGQ